jgi:hypothetical protein
MTCDSSTTYCKVSEGGAAGADGGSKTTYACTPFPLTCGKNPSCQCLGITTPGCKCDDSGGGLTVTCMFP